MEAFICQKGLVLSDDDARKLFGNKYHELLNKLTIIFQPKSKIGAPKKLRVYKYDIIDGINVLVLPRGMASAFYTNGLITTMHNMLPFPEKKYQKNLVENKDEVNLIGDNLCDKLPQNLRDNLSELYKSNEKAEQLTNVVCDQNTIPSQIAVCEKFPSYDGELYDNQRLIIDTIMNNQFTEIRATTGTATCLLDLGAGFGKTFVAAGLMSKICEKTLYITPNKDLKKQAEKDLLACFPDAKICSMNGKTATKNKTNKITVEQAHITLIVINSAAGMPDEFFAKFGFIIMDEIHKYASPKWSELFWRIQVKYMLGMTATSSQRLDGFDVFYQRQLGDILYAAKIEGFNNIGNDFKGEVLQVKYEGDPAYTKAKYSEATGKIFTPDMLKQFISDPRRNQLIVDKIVNLYNDKKVERHIFVFSEYRTHLDILLKSLSRYIDDAKLYAPELIQDDNAAIMQDPKDPNETKNKQENKIAIMRGGINDSQRDRARDSRIILTTYGYSSTGVSIPKMNAAVFATPRKSGFLQICPRIMRRGGDTSIVRKFVDIVDSSTSLSSQFRHRNQVYGHFAFTVIKENISFKDIIISDKNLLNTPEY